MRSWGEDHSSSIRSDQLSLKKTKQKTADCYESQWQVPAAAPAPVVTITTATASAAAVATSAADTVVTSLHLHPYRLCSGSLFECGAIIRVWICTMRKADHSLFSSLSLSSSSLPVLSKRSLFIISILHRLYPF